MRGCLELLLQQQSSMERTSSTVTAETPHSFFGGTLGTYAAYSNIRHLRKEFQRDLARKYAEIRRRLQTMQYDQVMLITCYSCRFIPIGRLKYSLGNPRLSFCDAHIVLRFI